MPTQRKIKVGSLVVATPCDPAQHGIVLRRHKADARAWDVYWFKEKKNYWYYECELELVV